MKMKPETIKRRAAARKKRVKAGRKNLEKRLSEKAKQEGPDSIWAEMLAELRSKNPMHKKKRSAKQLANDRRLGRMAKARAKAKRGGRSRVTRKKVAKRKTRKNPVRKIRAPGAKRHIRAPAAKRKASAKSPLYIIFKCKGSSVAFLGYGDGKPAWHTDKGKAILFKKKRTAANTARNVSKKVGMSQYHVGVGSAGITAAHIKSFCGGKA